MKFLRTSKHSRKVRRIKKRTYVTERIINIAQLENILQEESVLIGQIKMASADGSGTLQYLLNQLEQVNKKAVQFEFCIERRKTSS